MLINIDVMHLSGRFFSFFCLFLQGIIASSTFWGLSDLNVWDTID
jgi:hypothetical protein